MVNAPAIFAGNAGKLCRVRYQSLTSRSPPRTGVIASDSMAAAAKKEKQQKRDDAPAPANDTDRGPGEEAEASDDGETKARKKMSGKTLVLFVILPALLILGGGGAAGFMLLGRGGHAEQHADAGKDKAKGADAPGASAPGPNGTTIVHGENVVFVTLPEMLVNISGPGGQPGYLKLKLTLEAPNEEAVSTLTAATPRITDEFNNFLRELRTDDLVGSAGAYRLRLELLRRVNLVIAPQQINAVLIEEMLVQ
jgi:flagellar FliL protein